MCHGDVSPSGRAAVGSGGSRSVRLRNHARLHFRRHNYVIYQDIGSNLESGFLSFLGGLFSSSNQDFYYIDQTTPGNLNILFNVSRRSGIPSQYRPYESSAYGQWIYIFASHSRGDKIYEIHYRSATDWDATEYAWPATGSLQRVRDIPGGDYFQLNRAYLNHAYAIDKFTAMQSAFIKTGRCEL